MRPNKTGLTAQETAAAILARRACSEKELRTKLTEKGFSSDEIEAAVTRMQALGALDDIDYGCMLARHYQQRGWGPGRVKEELYKRGVPRAYWEEALESAGSFAQEAQRALKKKLGAQYEPEDIPRAAAFLIRRGFSREDIDAALRSLNESEE